MSEPIELVAKTTGKVVGFVCGKCSCADASMLISASWAGAENERVAQARLAAVDHCGPWFCACGKEREKYGTTCRGCRAAEAAAQLDAKERAAFERAEKVAASDWTGEYVWSDRFEDIFGHPADLLDRYDAAGEEPPEYVWECVEVPLVLNASDILDNECESQEAWEGLREQIGRVDEEALQALLDGWLKKRKLSWWREEHRRAVLLTKRGE